MGWSGDWGFGENQYEERYWQEILEKRKLAFESVIKYGESALKSAILINGGASVAILTFITQIWLKSPEIISSLLYSLVCFVSGTFFSSCATGMAYFTQWHHLTEDDKNFKRMRSITIWLVGLSYVLFFAGIFFTFFVLKSNIPKISHA